MTVLHSLRKLMLTTCRFLSHTTTEFLRTDSACHLALYSHRSPRGRTEQENTMPRTWLLPTAFIPTWRLRPPVLGPFHLLFPGNTITTEDHTNCLSQRRGTASVLPKAGGGPQTMPHRASERHAMQMVLSHGFLQHLPRHAKGHLNTGSLHH